MRLTSATVYALDIPFVETFRHRAAARAVCDSVVVRVATNTGVEGFGEGAPRGYVTGESVEWVVNHIAAVLWPAVAGRDLPTLRAEADLALLDAMIPDAMIPAGTVQGVLAPHASRAALELAIVDAILRHQNISVGEILPPQRRRVRYGGVVPASSPEHARQLARQLRLIGLTQIKVKVGAGDDVARVRAVRAEVGPKASLRVDANGAWGVAEALAVLHAIAPYDIAAVEQPLPRCDVAEWARLRRLSPIPLVADESVVTHADLDAFIAAGAADCVNVRVSKCGGFVRSLAIARRAATAGLGIQVGSQVGETAILSAAGRHLAATLPDVAFAEGSYGSLLLSEDVSADGVRFGHGGEARLLTHPGLGVRVVERRLRKYACQVLELGEEGGRS
jgi:L-alanine-DL-glutamate epimerase-like enolase superfamily enzyme